MDALLATIMLWLSFNASLPATAEMPKVAIVPAHDILFKRYRAFPPEARKEILASENANAALDKRRTVVAIYDNGTIYLPEGWTGTTPAEVSVLVHETVHHIQHTHGLRYECPAAREEIAYQAQEKWLAQFGTDLISEFDLDRFTLKVSTSCGF